MEISPIYKFKEQLMEPKNRRMMTIWFILSFILSIIFSVLGQLI